MFHPHEQSYLPLNTLHCSRRSERVKSNIRFWGFCHLFGQNTLDARPPDIWQNGAHRDPAVV